MHGRSNGGLLVGAAMTQRPELWAAALPTVGVLDMLRFHLFTIGWAWTTEYGTPDDPDDFAVLLAYSPLHRLAPGTAYPATLICTGDHDDRVVPAHSLKFGARAAALPGRPGAGAAAGGHQGRPRHGQAGPRAGRRVRRPAGVRRRAHRAAGGPDRDAGRGEKVSLRKVLGWQVRGGGRRRLAARSASGPSAGRS